jgi:hypothetical protein
MTAEVGLFKSSVISDTSGNGSVLSNDAVVDNAAQNLFPSVTEAERTAGLTCYRKALLKKLSGTLTSAKFMADILSRAGDYILLKRGFDDDTQAKASDYGWSDDNITWTLATRTVSGLTTARSLNAGDEVYFFTSAGVFRGRANVTTSTSSSTSFVIDAMTEGSNPANTDYAITFWKGSAELTQALTGGTSKTIMCAFEGAGLGIFSYKDIALIDWDTLTDGLPTIEYLDQSYAVYTIGTGGILDEDCSDITDWTDNDSAGAASTQATFQGRDTFSMTVTAHGAGRKAERYIDAGTIGTTYTIELRLYCDLIGTQAAGDYFSLAVDNGAATLGVRWCTDGLFVYDGAAWNEVGTNIVDSDVWTVWRLAVTTGATVAVYKNGFLMAAAQDCSDATTATDGLVTIAQNGVTTDNVISYVDFVKLSDLVKTDSTECFIQADAACVSNHAVKTQGVVTGTADEDFDVDGLTLVVKVNGGTSQTVTFEGNGQTAAQVVAQISVTGATASVSSTTKIAITTDSYYSENSIQVLSDSTADTELGLDNSVHYGTDGTVVAAYLDLGTIAASHSTPVKSSPAGTFTDNIVNYDLGASYDAWTVTFSSATAFTVAGATAGTIGSGTVSTTFAVAHWGSYYFSIPSTCWGGTWANGDTLTFTSYPSAEGIWFKEIVPAGAASYSGNKATYTLDGETA